MLKTRGRKIIRDVMARKGRTALVSIAIFIGVTGVIALFTMSNVLVRQLEEDIQEDELAMAYVYVSADSNAQLRQRQYLQDLNDFTGVTEVMGGFEDDIFYFKIRENDERFDDGIIQAHQALNAEGDLVNVPFEAEQPLEPIRLVEGQFPREDTQEIVVESRFADEYNVEVGDSIFIRILSPSKNPELNNETGTVEEWTITGIVFDPYSFSPDSNIYTYVSDANYITNLPGYTNFRFRFTDYETAEAQFDKVLDMIVQDMPYTTNFSQTEDPAESQLIAGAQLLGSLMGFLAMVALIVSGFLVVNVISSIVVEQKRQIGVMKSMGATRADNFYIFSGIAFMYGLIGVTFGVLVGIPLGNAVAHALAPEVNTVLDGFQFSLGAVIIGILMGLAVPVLASVIPVFNGTRVKILDAMTDLGIGSQYGTGPLARLIKVLPLPITVRQGISNVSIKKGRLVFTVLTLAVAVGAFMGIFAIFETMLTGINDYIDSFNAQLLVAPGTPRDPDEFITFMESEFGEDIASIEEGFNLQVEFEGYEPEAGAGGPPGIFAYGYDVTSETPAFNYTVDEGERLSADTPFNGIVVSSKLANGLDKGVGDTAVLVVPGNTLEVEIVGIVEYPIDQLYMRWETLAQIGGWTFDRIASDSPLALTDVVPPEFGDYIKYVSGVQVDDHAGSLPGEATLVMGITPVMEQLLEMDEGNFFTTDDPTGEAPPGVIVTRTLADSAGLVPNSTITLTSLTEGSEPEIYRVTGIFEVPPMLGEGAIPSDFMAMYWRDLAELDGAEVESKPRPQAYFIITPKDEPTAKEIDEVADRINDELIAGGVPNFSLNMVELTEDISSGFRQFQFVLQGVALLIAAIGALGLLTTLSMSVFERQKEIGVMRSIGAGSSTVATQFLTEGLVTGVIAWIVGLPLMLLLQYGLLSVTGFIDTFPIEISVGAVLLGLIGMLLISTIASIWPSLGAARKTVSDILRYQ